ncbi:MAG: divalent-cation tolerance protein CutA [Dolichospermum sp. DEX189]|jgi:periplasmic divalent cation tolerance protein|uniref:Divalent-cation tolerance protein CutA n=1 Tax=Aphanizomenon flos-aquae FACHB-1040 TaxID=2692887 RepID=A0ABR8BY62_APHFL|nr:divalent-cation tolerance protein CutA [Aphanizomenon flos-aquae]MBD2279390.1 divalent-cation tolerance protein CutA [Aphanizomenon flos-aquae FACHB-1040]MBO1072383.1 divalent-cation tolerance protein CutA [Dolichospermum sp. DEX189]
MEFLFVYVTCKDRAEALNVGRAVVEARLAACANIIDGIDGIYWWQGELQVEKEAILIMKSRRDLFAELTAKVKSVHSYQVPCVVALPVVACNYKYSGLQTRHFPAHIICN